MPIYEYECTACKTRFERSQRFSDPPVTECPECGGPVRRVLFPAGIVFKGSGWYVTDSRKPASDAGSSSADAAKPDAAKPETKTEGAKTETKGESKPAASTTGAPASSGSPPAKTS